MSLRRGAQAYAAGVALLLARLSAVSPALATEPTKEQCIEANESAQDLRLTGKLHEARRQLAICLAESCPGLLRQDCGERMKELDAVQPAVVFEAKDSEGNDVSGVRVTMDGLPLTQGLDGSAIPLDLGEHHFVFESDGHPTTKKTLTTREGETNRHERIHFGPASSDPRVSSGGQGRKDELSGGLGPRRVVGLAVAGVGGVLIGAGIGTGLAATSKHSTLVSECPNAPACPTSAAADLSSFHTFRTASTATYIVGAVAAVGGGVLFLIPQSKPSMPALAFRPWIGLGSAGLYGSF